MRRALLLFIVVLAACGSPSALGNGEGGGNPPPNPKFFVCKYETTPGGGERLQSGQNPISVSENAFPAGVTPAVGVQFNDAQGRSLIIAEDIGQPEPSPDACPPLNGGTTTTTATTAPPTSTTTTSPPTPALFAIEVEPLCPDGTVPEIEITFGNRPDLDGQTGTLTLSTGGSMPLTFDANNTTTIPYPASAGTDPVTMTYVLGAESVTRSTTFPEACAGGTTTTVVVPNTNAATTTTTQPSGQPPVGATTTTVRPPTAAPPGAGETTTTLPGTVNPPGAPTNPPTTAPPSLTLPITL